LEGEIRFADLNNSFKYLLNNNLIMTKTNKENKELKKIKPVIVRILKKNGVVRAGIFGSYVRGKQKKKSDIDILVEIKKKISLFDFAGIKIELEEKLGKKVDLVEYKMIKPQIKDNILNSEVRII